ncbi:uncharacterized protein LOC142612996 isoform X2 [Castanea sativa]
MYQDIDQIGSCFSKDVFDPHGYDKSDYYFEIVQKHAWQSCGRVPKAAPQAAETLRITATKLCKLQIADGVIPLHKLKKHRRKAIDTPWGKIKPWVSNVPLLEIWGPPPSWKGNSSITKETLMAASQTARYRETFNILGSQESIDAPPSLWGESENGKKGSRG